MELYGEAKLLRIFVGSRDKMGSTPLYEAIVLAAKKFGIAGATVLRGVMGYGANSFVHTARILTLSEDLPMVIEMVDESSKIDDFIKQVERFFDHPKYGGLITTEKVQVLVYKKHTA